MNKLNKRGPEERASLFVHTVSLSYRIQLPHADAWAQPDFVQEYNLMIFNFNVSGIPYASWETYVYEHKRENLHLCYCATRRRKFFQVTLNIVEDFLEFGGYLVAIRTRVPIHEHLQSYPFYCLAATPNPGNHLVWTTVNRGFPGVWIELI